MDAAPDLLFGDQGKNALNLIVNRDRMIVETSRSGLG
jgi:hypothetical protein